MRMRTLSSVLLVLVVLAMVGFALGPRLVASYLNPTLPPPTRTPSAAAARLHETLTIADLHSDALLWDRGLVSRSAHGHVDLPRLIEGRVAVEAFTVVTQTPWGMNLEANAADSDQIQALAILQLWPPRTWTGLPERALHQAAKLRRAAAASGGRLTIVRTREDLDGSLRAREDRALAEDDARGDASAPEIAGARHEDEAMVAAFLGLEGAHVLEGDLSNLDRLFDAGFRMLGLTHFFDNEVGGSAHGVEQGGLTDFGRRVVDRMAALGMIVDLAHASPQLIDDVLARADGPVVVSHTGVDGTCPGPRNLDDRRLEAIAATGGVVGIGLWPAAVCGETADDWARAVRHAVDRIGARHVALGSDWDGAVPAIVDASGTMHLTDALLRAGLEAEEIRGIMGGNAIRVLRSLLPSGGPNEHDGTGRILGGEAKRRISSRKE